jgi:hypothetical protein
MDRIAELIDLVLTRRDDRTVARVQGMVEDLASGFPLYAPAVAPAMAGAR